MTEHAIFTAAGAFMGTTEDPIDVSSVNGVDVATVDDQGDSFIYRDENGVVIGSAQVPEENDQ